MITNHVVVHLEHYRPLLAQKPCSVFNEKPVRHSVGNELTVKLLQLSFEKLLAIKDLLPKGINCACQAGHKLEFTTLLVESRETKELLKLEKQLPKVNLLILAEVT